MKRLTIPFFAACAAAALAAEAPAVDYPEGYRDWRHVKSMVIGPEHGLAEMFGGIHHLYANGQAMEGYRSGNFPDGAVIVFDLLEANAADHTVTEGSRKLIGVMQRDAARFASTGGWGFEGFKGDSRTERLVGDAAATACFACHQASAGADFVFSDARD